MKNHLLTINTEISNHPEILNISKVLRGEDVELSTSSYEGMYDVSVKCYSFSSVIASEVFFNQNHIAFYQVTNTKYTKANPKSIIKEIYHFLCKSGRYLEAREVLSHLKTRKYSIPRWSVLRGNSIAHHLIEMFDFFGDDDWGY